MGGNQLKLTTLDVGNNQIGVIENIAHLKGLEEFWVRPTGAPLPRVLRLTRVFGVSGQLQQGP